MFKTSFSIAGLMGAALFAFTGAAHADSFNAPLVQCKSVTSPAALTNCASSQDPLSSGGVTIDDQGDVTVIVNGAVPNTPYAVSLVSNDGTQSTLIGNLKTGAHGDGAISEPAFFKFGTVGAGNVVLTRTSPPDNEEFVSGLIISITGLQTARDFQPSLVRCTDVITPGVLASCGSDSLSSGRIDLENPDGAMSIRIYGARPSTTYSAIFRAPNGTSIALGSVGPTNSSGNASKTFDSGTFAAGTVGSGAIVLQSGGTDEFETGFKVNQKFVKPDVAISNLVQCGAVTDPTGLSCGSDPLDSGDYQVNTGGAISVALKGAAPGTNYEVWFRPLNDPGTGDVDTGILVPTDKYGNASVGPTPYFSSGVDAGTLVIKQKADSALDQFDAAFKTN